MSQENVELARRMIESWNLGDWTAFRAIHDPDVVGIPVEGWPDGETVYGIDAWVREAMMLSDSWGEQRVEIVEARAVGERVLLVVRWITRGRDTQLNFDTTLSIAIELTNGKLARLAFFADRAEALVAVGLSE